MKKIQTGSLRRRLSVGMAGAKSGVGLLQSKASGLLLPAAKREAHNQAALEREALSFVQQLGKLKGAYVKIGQMLALYGEHLLPAPVTRALHTLEDQTTALDWSVVQPQLGEAHAQLKVEAQAFAAASLAQVHKASCPTLGEDQPLCLKVQYPGIADTIDDDFKQVMQMLSLAHWIPSGKQLDEVTRSLKNHLEAEVDYALELQKTEQVRDLLGGDNRYRIPKYFPALCNSQILTMEFVDGLEVSHTEVQALSQIRRNRLGRAMLELFFKEGFEWGLMQTDPNFGNYRILLDHEQQQDQLVLLDFGAVHPITQSFSTALRQTIISAWQRQRADTIDGLIGLNCLRRSDSQEVKDSFAEFCEFMMEPFRPAEAQTPANAFTKDGVYDWRASRLLKRSGKVAAKGMLIKGFSVPPSEFVLMTRKLTGVFTFIAAIGAQFNAGDLLEQYR